MSTSTFETARQWITGRRSIFQKDFTGQAVSKETILQLLECAHAAPTHKRTQPWRFVVFQGEGKQRLADNLADLYQTHTDPEKYLEKSREALRGKVLDSGAVIAIIIRYSGAVPAWEETAAVGAAVQNLWLAGSAAGIGGYWGTPGIIKHTGGLLKLGENEECLGFFYMGYHGNAPQPPNRVPLEEKIRWEE